ncbi:alpha/beta hydrolase, partial [Methylobacterium indicum]
MAGGDWRGMDRATLSRAYDNSGAVAGSSATMAALRARSAAFRERQAGALDLPYGEGERQRFDLFRCGRAGAPLLAFIHGGYWQRNDKHGFSALAEGPLARGLDVAMIGYTLCPGATMTALSAEIPAALSALRAHANPPRLVVSGWSAGGHLAALAMTCPEVDAGLAVSGIFDLAPIRRTALDDALQ